MALPKFVPTANPAGDLASVLARIQVKLPHVAVPMPRPTPAEPTPDIQPIAAASDVQCTSVTPETQVDVAPTPLPISRYSRKQPAGVKNPQSTSHAYLYVPSDDGEKWREGTIEKRYPKLDNYLKTVRRVLLSPLARFQLFDTVPPRDCLVYCGSPEDGVPGNELWSECVGMPHGEFMGDLS